MKIRKPDITIQDILSGNVFTKDFFKRQYRLLVLIVLLIFISINSGYKGNAQRQQIRKLQKEITKSRYEMLDLSATYTELTRASSISQQLKDQNSKVKEASKPPIRIQ